MMDLQDKRVLVTGGARGIGAAIARALAARGAWVAVNHPGGAAQAEAEEVVGAIDQAQTQIQTQTQIQGRAFAVCADVGDEAAVLAMFSELDARMGGLDIVVNNAGVIFEKPLLDTTAADFDVLMAVNLRGSFLVGREAIGRMTAQKNAASAGGPGDVWGRVINISSDLSFAGRADFSPYCASKGAINALTKSWAREFGPAILVNAIAPGPVDTAMLDLASMSPQWRKKEEDIPLCRVGQPEEIAALAVFLCGPGANFITGQILGVNGGCVMP